MPAASFTRSFLLLFSGPIIWTVHFLAIYSWTGVLCARPSWATDRMIVSGIVLVSVAAVAAITLIHVRIWMHTAQPMADAGFLRRTAAALGLLSALAIVWETLPAYIVPACG